MSFQLHQHHLYFDFLKLFDHSSLGVYQLIIPYSTSGACHLCSNSRVSIIFVQHIESAPSMCRLGKQRRRRSRMNRRSSWRMRGGGKSGVIYTIPKYLLSAKKHHIVCFLCMGTRALCSTFVHLG